jgi:hypothetical protein
MPGWPDKFVGKIAQNVAQPVFCQNWYTTFTTEKNDQKCGLLLWFSKKLPNVSNRLIGEISPNLGPMLWFLKYFRQKIQQKKLAFLTQNKAKLCKIWIITLIFEKNVNFFAENCRKSPKSVIITSTPGHWEKKLNFPILPHTALISYGNKMAASLFSEVRLIEFFMTMATLKGGFKISRLFSLATCGRCYKNNLRHICMKKRLRHSIRAAQVIFCQCVYTHTYFFQPTTDAY